MEPVDLDRVGLLVDLAKSINDAASILEALLEGLRRQPGNYQALTENDGAAAKRRVQPFLPLFPSRKASEGPRESSRVSVSENIPGRATSTSASFGRQANPMRSRSRNFSQRPRPVQLDFSSDAESLRLFSALTLNFGRDLAPVRRRGSINARRAMMIMHRRPSIAQPKSEGLSQAEIASLSRTVLTADQEAHCCICIEQLKDREETILLPCTHKFHASCISTWLKRTPLCPLCKVKAS